MAELIFPAPWRALSAGGAVVPSAQAFFYVSGTDTLQPVYLDQAGTSAAPSPLLADSEGVFPRIYNTSANSIRVDVRDPVTGDSLPGYPDNVTLAVSTSDSAAAQTGFSPTAEIPVTNVQAAIERVQSNVDGARTGSDGGLVTGTAGTTGQYAVWNGDGDIVGQALPTADTATWEAGTSTTEAIVSPADVKAAVDAVVDATGVRRYVSPSGNATWESSLVTEAHGMGGQPFFLAAYVVCLTADGGWSPGDRIWLGQFENGNLGGHAASDATNLYWRGGTSQRFFQKGSSANFDPIESRWELYFFALF